MEVPVILRLNDFRVGLNSLQSGILSVSLAYNFCKWGAVILALVATFGSIINRVRILIVKFRRTHSLPSIPLLSELDDDDFTSTDDEGTYPSSSSPSSDFEEDEDEPAAASSSYFNWRQVDGDFGVRGSGHQIDDQLQSGNVRLRQHRSIGEFFPLSEIVNCKSVVKLWGSIEFGLGLDFDDCESSSPGSVISNFDVSKEQRIGTIPFGKPPMPVSSSSSAAVVVSAGVNELGKLALKIWDRRLRQRIPAVIAEWGPDLGKITGVSSGRVDKVYVRDDAGYGVVVGDMRKVNSPLGNVTESDVDKWWDGDAVILSNEVFGEKAVLQRK